MIDFSRAWVCTAGHHNSTLALDFVGVSPVSPLHPWLCSKLTRKCNRSVTFPGETVFPKRAEKKDRCSSGFDLFETARSIEASKFEHFGSRENSVRRMPRLSQSKSTFFQRATLPARDSAKTYYDRSECSQAITSSNSSNDRTSYRTSPVPAVRAYEPHIQLHIHPHPSPTY
jgi:hypothetical protein